MVDREWPDLPDSFEPRIGDAIHNYRSALDHVAWQLAIHGSRPPSQLSDEAQKRIQFPIHETLSSFKKKIGQRLPGVNTTARGYIKTRHQYVGGHATNDALVSLARLSNQDKHRALIYSRPHFLNVQHQVSFERCAILAMRDPPGLMAPVPKKDAVVTIIECRATGTDPKVTMKSQPSFHVALEDGRGFGDVLAAISAEVSEILHAPEMVQALS